METEGVKYKSLQKAIAVLNCFTVKPRLGVTEICELLGLNKSNVHDILNTLKSVGYLDQDEETSKYKLGIGIFMLSRALGDQFSISKIARPYLQELSNRTNERVYLAVPHEDEALYLDAIHPADSSRMMRSLLGERARMYCTGIGKAMMAYLPQQSREEYAGRELPCFTNYTITDRDALLAELDAIRERGYALDNMEHEFGVKCVAVPIFDRDGQIYAAISISGPSLRFEGARMEELILLIREYAAKIEQQLL